MNLEILSQIGLSENEIKVYFALLEIGQTTATPIVRKSEVSNSKVYQTLEKLIRKGLVSYVLKDNKKNFQATNPKRLLELLDEKKEIISKQEQLIKDLIPKIEAKKQESENKNDAMVYEGYKGMISAFNLILDSLKSNEEYYVFMLGESLKEDNVKLFFKQFNRKRIEKNIIVKLLSQNKHKKAFSIWNKLRGLYIKYTNQKLPVGTFIFKNHVMTVNWDKEPTAFVLKSKNNYEYYKDFFLELWKNSKK